MKLSEAYLHAASNNFVKAELMRNPSNQNEWFIMLRKKSGKSFMLINDDESVVVGNNVEELFPVLKKLGFNQILVHIPMEEC